MNGKIEGVENFMKKEWLKVVKIKKNDLCLDY